MPEGFSTRAEMREETAEAVCEIAICIAQAIHEMDPAAHRRMNFNAGLAYNRLLGEKRTLAADILYRFGRALMDHKARRRNGLECFQKANGRARAVEIVLHRGGSAPDMDAHRRA